MTRSPMRSRVGLLVVGCVVAISGWRVLGQEIGSSVVGTEIDFITRDDISVYESLRFMRFGLAEMPDKRNEDAELMRNAFEFEAKFRDGCSVRIIVDAAFGIQEAAESEAKRYTGPLGRLPSVLRKGVSRLVVHQGGPKTTAFSDEGLIVVYADNASVRIRNHDLEETIFHESVHAAWDKKYAASEDWKRAQHKDGKFITLYAKRNPAREDLAESALFAYTLTHHPNRLPEELRQRILESIPYRVEFVARLLPEDRSIMDVPETSTEAGRQIRKL